VRDLLAHEPVDQHPAHASILRLAIRLNTLWALTPERRPQ
jgi:hypothetical protein